ncbi:hypothetical protein ACFE04_029694 [Oxalis oulophora]
MPLLTLVSAGCTNKQCPILTKVTEKQKKKERVGAEQNGEVRFLLLERLAPPLLVAAFVTLSPLCITPASLGQTVDIQRGATLFSQACIGCHVDGGNLIQPGSTLFTKDLQRNGVDTEEEIYNVTYFGKGRMPGFGEKCTPRGQCTFGVRLADEDIKMLAQFVKLQADQGWPPIATSED